MIPTDEFLPRLRAAIRRDDDTQFSVSEEFVSDALSGIGEVPSQFRMGVASPKTKDGREYQEVGWDGAPETCGPFGKQIVTSDPLPVVVSMMANFFASVAGRRFICNHDVFEFRVLPEVSLRNYGCCAQFYARLVSYESDRARKHFEKKVAALKERA